MWVCAWCWRFNTDQEQTCPHCGRDIMVADPPHLKGTAAAKRKREER